MSKAELGYLLVLPRFEYVAAGTVEEACALLSQYAGKAMILAGGTDVLVEMKKRHIFPEYVIGIKSISDLDYIRYDEENGLRIGALTNLQSVADSDVVRQNFSPLATACKKVGTPQVRNVATLAGNVCMAGPSQDTPPSLICLGAQLKITGGNENRIVPIGEFYTGPFQNQLRAGELLTEIYIPTLPPRSDGSYLWHTKATEVCETLAGVAVVMTLDPSGKSCEDIKIALCSTVAFPKRAMLAEETIRGKTIDEDIIEKTARAASTETAPRSRAEYRTRMTYLLTRDAISEVWNKIKETLVLGGENL